MITPTRIYVKPILEILKQGIEIHAMAHITGGGLPENLPRCLAVDQSIRVNPNKWKLPPIFKWLADTGNIKPEAMFNTFNMGIGFVLIVAPELAEMIINKLEAQNIATYQIGEVIKGDRSLIFEQQK